jgi:hypothetical protein
MAPTDAIRHPSRSRWKFRCCFRGLEKVLANGGLFIPVRWYNDGLDKKLGVVHGLKFSIAVTRYFLVFVIPLSFFCHIL